MAGLHVFVAEKSAKTKGIYHTQQPIGHLLRKSLSMVISTISYILGNVFAKSDDMHLNNVYFVLSTRVAYDH